MVKVMAGNARVIVFVYADPTAVALSRALDALRANAEPHDVVVVDDGSHLDPQAVVETPGLTLLRSAHTIGPAAAFTFALKHMLRGDYDYIALAGADDVSAPGRLGVQRAFLDDNPDVSLVGAWAVTGTEPPAHTPQHHDAILAALYGDLCMHPSSLMFRAQALHDLGGFSDQRQGDEAYEMVCRFAHHARVANIPQELVECGSGFLPVRPPPTREWFVARLKTQWTYRNWQRPAFYAGLLLTASRYYAGRLNLKWL